jgi:hypothetical protein
VQTLPSATSDYTFHLRVTLPETYSGNEADVVRVC